MSLGMYLSIVPSDNSTLVLLNNCMENAVSDEGTYPIFGINAADKLDQVIRAKIALDANFKSKIPFDASVVRQFEMFFEQLGTIKEGTDDPWVKHYAGLYKFIREQQTQEMFIYNILYSVNNETLKKWRSKNEKPLNSFFTSVNQELQNSRLVLDPAPYGFTALGFSKPVQAWYDDKHRLDAIGEKVNDVRKGHWVYFHDNAQRSGEGNYNELGTRVGVWKYYRDAGTATSIENYDTGEITVYFPSGNKQEHFFLKDEKTEGRVDLFYECGEIKETAMFKNDLHDGKGKTFCP